MEQKSVSTLQGICLSSLAAQLPDLDVFTIKDVFEAEVVKRQTIFNIQNIRNALPTWAMFDEFSVKITAHNGYVYAISLFGKKFVFGDREICDIIVDEDMYSIFYKHRFTDGVSRSLSNILSAEHRTLIPKMAEELMALCKKPELLYGA